MKHLLCKHEVADFDKWYAVFSSHGDAQKESGLRLINLLRDAVNPNLVVMWFEVEDMDKANAFMSAPEAYAAAEKSGVIGTPEVHFLDG